MTFLPRNRRVELQAFGRTARKGQPGSVQCILRVSSLRPHYRNHDLGSIRELRATEEQRRLDQLISSDVREVRLRETLFKQHCHFLKYIHNQVHQRDDKAIVLDSLNESWGQWLQMKREQIELFERQALVEELGEAHRLWDQDIRHCFGLPISSSSSSENTAHLPVTNFYHVMKFGNRLLAQDEKNAYRASRFYEKSIEMEPGYAAFAHYNHAYCAIAMSGEGYIDRAMSDLEKAWMCLDPYISEVSSVLQCVTLVNQIRGELYSTDGEGAKDFKTQAQVRMQIFDFIKKKIKEAYQALCAFKKDKKDVIAEPLGVFSLIPGPDYITHMELYTMWNLGMEVVFSVKEKPRFCWAALVVCLLGIAELVGGVLLTVFTVGTAASIGMTLISEGISDFIEGVQGMITGEFSWVEWGISKATSLAISLVSGGIANVMKKGVKNLKVGYSLGKRLRELKAIPKIAKNISKWGQAARSSFVNVAKYIGKEVAQQVIMTGISHAENRLLEGAVAEIGQKCKILMRHSLRCAFFGGEMGKVVDLMFIQKLPDSYVSDDKMSPAVREDARAFTSWLGFAVVEDLATDSAVSQRLKQISLSFLSQMSRKHSGGKAVYTAIEMGLMAKYTADALNEVDSFTRKFIPGAESKCKQFLSSSFSDHEQSQNGSIQDLKCASDLKEELTGLMGDVFSEAVASILLKDIGFVVNHALNRTVNSFAGKLLSSAFQTGKTMEAIAAGQNANYILYVEAPSHSSRQATHAPGEHSQREKPSHGAETMVDSYSQRVQDPNTPGSLLEARLLAEKSGVGLTIYHEKNGKVVHDYSIDPPSGGSGANIELVYIPPSRDHPDGHYRAKNADSQHSEASNCLYHAFTCSMHPDLPPSAQREHARVARQEVADIFREEPHKWKDHISRRLEMDRLYKGGYYARTGGLANEASKVLKECHAEEISGKNLNTRLLQQNGVYSETIRRYDDNITTEDGRVLSKGERLQSMTVLNEGLKFGQGGRCWTTDPVSGMADVRLRNEQLFTSITYHVSPSEAGANASSSLGNAVGGSTYINKMERECWRAKVDENQTVKQWIGNEPFSMLAEFKMGSIVPKPKEFDNFFGEVNKARVAEKMEPFHSSQKSDLQSYLTQLQEKIPSASRIEKHDYWIKNHKNEVLKLSMSPDVLHCIPHHHIPKPSDLQHLEVTPKPKASGHKYQQQPTYQESVRNPDLAKRFNNDKTFKISGLGTTSAKRGLSFVKQCSSIGTIDVGKVYYDRKNESASNRGPGRGAKRVKHT